MKQIEFKTSINEPFDWLHREGEWTLLADFSDSQEYIYLDDIYRVIKGSITEEEFYDFGYKKVEDFKAEYQKRFPLLLADFMAYMAKEIKSGKIVLKICY